MALRGAPIRGDWSKGTTKPPKAPDERAAYLQRLLARAGFDIGPVDGIVGDRTEKALKAYQSKFGLKATGTFDAATAKSLRDRFEKAPDAEVKLPVEPAKDATITTAPGPEKGETAVIIAPTPDTKPSEEDKTVSKTGWAAIGAFILSLIAGAARYFGAA